MKVNLTINNYVRYMIFLHLYYQNHRKSKNLFIRKPLYKKKSTDKKSIYISVVFSSIYLLLLGVFVLSDNLSIL